MDLDFFSIEHGALVGLTLMIVMLIKNRFPSVMETKWGERLGPLLPIAVAMICAALGLGGTAGVILVKLKTGFLAGVTAAWTYKLGKTTGTNAAVENVATKAVDKVSSAVAGKPPADPGPGPSEINEPIEPIEPNDPKEGI